MSAGMVLKSRRTNSVTQTARILHALQHGDRLTPIDALRRFGCLRLAARVYDLKAAGHDIQERLVRVGDTEVAEYSLVPAGELFAVAERWE